MERKRSYFFRYGIALLISAVTLFFKFLLEPYISPHTFLLSIAAVTLCSWYGGIGPGMLATLFAAWANHVFFLSNNYSSISSNINDLMRLTMFILVALLINSLNAKLRAARLRAEQAAHEAQLAYREAEAANQAKDAFLTMVSHELRTPLTAILGWVELANAEKENQALHTQAFEVIRRNAKAQAELIEDLLDISRIVAGKLQLNLCPVEPAAIIRAAIDTVTPAAAKKKIEIEMALEAEVGQLSADPDRLQQVILNLLTNAVKFTPEQGQIGISLTREDDWVVITVRDNGKGIDPDFLPYVFERFRQAEGSRKYGGLGLGLAIVRLLVEMQGGNVKAESEGLGKGSVFTIRLPLLKKLPAPVRQQNADLAAPTSR